MRRLISFLLLAVMVAANAKAEESKADGKVTATASESVSLAKSEGEKPDLAFGAYQRGHYLTAFNLALPRAEAGDAAAQTLIAHMFDQGRGVGQDGKLATEWYGVAASSGNREAQFAYAMKLLEGKHVARDPARAFELIEKAADAGHPLAMHNFAMHIIDQRPTSAGYKRALSYLKKSAKHRLADSYYALAQIEGEGLATGIGNAELGRSWLERAAKSGHDTAQVELAIALMNGENGKKDEKQAALWFAAAARTGNVIAQNRLAHLLFDGIHVKQNGPEAGKWHILSSRAGRGDPDLELKFSGLSDADRKEALERANRWQF